MLIWYFPNNLDIYEYVGKLPEQHFSVWLFSNPGYKILLCTLPGRRPGIAEGDERTRLGRVHLYFFLLFTKYSFLGYYRLLLLEVTMPKTEATN